MPASLGKMGVVEASTFTEHVGQINATAAFFEDLAQQPDDGPIINLKFLRYRPRQDATVYNRYGAVAGRAIGNVGASMAHHAEVVQGLDSDYGFSSDGDGVPMPVDPRRTSYIQLQDSVGYQGAIPDRVAGTFARLAYVLSDDKPLLDATSSIAAMYGVQETDICFLGQSRRLRIAEIQGRRWRR